MAWSRLVAAIPCGVCGVLTNLRHQIEVDEREVEGIRVVRTKAIYRCSDHAPAARVAA